jgi:TolB-like protein/Flp pilus assembly protein TadD
VTEQATRSADRGLSSADEERLESWKEIASYLKRDVRTVQRWEKREGLPVHRHQHEKLGSVYAYKGQLDAWRTNGHSGSAPEFQAAATQPRRRIVLWTLLAVAGALLGIGIHWFAKTFFASKVVLAVQPFRNLGEKSDDFISAGLTEEMIARLGQLHPGRLSLIALTENGIPRLSDFRFSKIHADYVLEGTVRRFNDQVAITAQLIQASDHTVAWGNSYERDVRDLLRVQTAVADAIITEVFNKLPHATPPARELNRDAYLAYLEGRYFRGFNTTESIQKAILRFEKSINIDPTYAPAYVGLSDCYELLGSAPWTTLPPKEAFPKAEAAARKALQLDDTLAEAHDSLAMAYLVYEWDFPSAHREFRRALDLRPTDLTAHHFYAYYLTVAGNLREAILERKKAVDLDPISSGAASALGDAYYQARQFDQTIVQNERALELDPRNAIALVNLGRAYQQKGKHAEAQAAFQKILSAVPDDPAVLALLGHEYAVSGRHGDARQAIAKLQILAAHRYVPALYFAVIYIGMGDKDDAFRWLDTAVSERSEYLVYLGSEPLADPLRNDPRFSELLKRVGISGKPIAHPAAN